MRRNSFDLQFRCVQEGLQRRSHLANDGIAHTLLVLEFGHGRSERDHLCDLHSPVRFDERYRSIDVKLINKPELSHDASSTRVRLTIEPLRCRTGTDYRAAMTELTESDSWGLQGKSVLVTGAASGIGEATARLASQDGANVLVCDLASSDGQAVADRIGATFVTLDVASVESWRSLVEGLESLDIAVLNAGVAFRPPKDFFRFVDDPGSWDLDLYRRATAVNIDGVALGLHHLVPVIAEGGGGSITATASLAGLIPWTPDPVYSMTKWAVVGLVRAASKSLSRQNITLNAICPGGVATPLIGVVDGSVPTGMAHPDFIAKAHLAIATSGQTGRAIKAVVGHPYEAHQFAEVTNTD